MEFQTVRKVRFTAVLSFFMLSGVCTLAGGDAKADNGRFVLVQVQPRNFLVTPSKVKAGPVRILVENLTLIPSPSVGVRLQSSTSSLDGIKLDKQLKIRPRESWQEVVLTPGSYWVYLEQDPGAKGQLIVEP